MPHSSDASFDLHTKGVWDLGVRARGISVVDGVSWSQKKCKKVMPKFGAKQRKGSGSLGFRVGGGHGSRVRGLRVQGGFGPGGWGLVFTGGRIEA